MKQPKIIEIIKLNNFQAIAVNIIGFCDWFLTDKNGLFNCITEKSVLQTGLYGTCFNTNIYCAKDVSNNCFKIGELIDNKYNWSLEIPIDLPIDKIDRILRLKAFW